MSMKYIVAALAILAAACATSQGITVSGVTLPDGTYSYSLRPSTSSARAEGKVVLLGDSISVENDRACPISYNPDGHGMSVNCNGYSIKVANYGGKWTMFYTLDGYQVEQKRTCADQKINRAGTFDCVRWEVDRIESPTTSTVPLTLFVVDTARASTKKD